MGLIYRIIRKDSGRVYVGMTIRDSLEGRYPGGWIRRSCNSELRSDADRLGEVAFEVKTEAVANADLPNRETAIIREYKKRNIPLYNNLGAHPSLGIKRGQRQKYVAYVRQELLVRFDLKDDYLVDLWTKTSSGTNKDEHSKGHNAKNSQRLLEAEMKGPQPSRFKEVLSKVVALIDDVKRECPTFGYKGGSLNRIHRNMKLVNKNGAVAFRIAKQLEDANECR